MNLTPEQKSTVVQWVADKLSLSDIQKQLETELGIIMTYMDVRFLVDDLGVELSNETPEFSDPQKDLSAAPVPDDEVSVVVDKLTRPGSLISGTVTFTDGESAQWMLDQMGRLSLSPSTKDYQPSQDDVRDFQKKLQEAVEKSGML